MLHRTLRSFFVLILVFGLVAIPSPPSARAAGPWHVAATGNDSNDCLSPGSECATINAAISRAAPGDTIRVGAGLYTGINNEVVFVDKDVILSGGWDETFSAQTGLSTIDGNGVRRGMHIEHGIYAVVDFFKVQNGNTAGLFDHGGGISNDGTLTLNDSLITGNQAESGTGGGVVNLGLMILNRTAMTDNTAIDGGGIANFGSLVLNNSTVSGNTSSRDGSCCAGGGGIYNYHGSDLRINSSTISDNVSLTIGGGIANFASAVLQNTILANNAGSSPDCNGDFNSSGYNIIGDTFGCDFIPVAGDLVNTNPLLGQLIGPSGNPGYHALLSGSPAIDAGNPASCDDHEGNPITTDQRGVARTGPCDRGAYEYTTPGSAVSLSAVGGNHQITGTSSAFPEPLRAAALDSQGSPVSGITIEFTAPASGPGGTFEDTNTNHTTADTDAGGVAATSTFTANNQAGAYSVSASSAGLGTVDFSLEQVIRPANDGFAGAQVISLPFTTTADITNATTELNEPGNCYSTEKTVWYSFTPAESMVVQANVLGSSIEGNLNIYRAGTDISDMQFLVCTGPSTSPTFLAEANQTYYLQVGPASGGAGEVQINVEAVTAPGNDRFTNAIDVGPLPSAIDFNIAGATFESSDPLPSCVFSSPPFRTVWFTLTATEDQAISARLVDFNFSAFVAAYSGTSLNTLTELGCQQYPDGFPVQLTAGQTYYFQVGVMFGEGGTGTLSLDPPAPPMADFSYFPFEPSSFSAVQFCDNSFDPAHIGFESFTWDFGDAAASTDICALHQYAADGDYTVQHAATTIDGRTASTSQVIHVRTHDVSITRVTAPQSAHSGQTKAITVSIRNARYAETVTVDLFKSSPNGDVWIGSLTLQVPVLSGNRTRLFTFNYTFTPEDAQIGKVTFKAMATIVGANDAFTQDNTGISSPPTRVTR